jgi:hypothetical protein
VLNAELERRVEERTAELAHANAVLSGSASKSTGSNARTGWCRCSTRCKTWRAWGSWPQT